MSDYNVNRRSRLSRAFILPILSLALLSSVIPAAAQSAPGRISGTVFARATSAPLPAVYVRVLDTKKEAIADRSGVYVVDDIPPGTYNVGFELPGYRSLIRTNVSVAPGRATELTVVMDRDEASESDLRVYQLEEFTVEEEASYFEADPEIEVSGRSIDSQEIMSASGAFKDIQRVVQVLPSVTSGADQENEIIVRGGNYGENLFVMDGIEIPNPNHFAYQGAGGGPISILPAEIIRDVNFIAGAFPARYGDKASSVMDISLRNGARDQFLTYLDTSMGGVRGIAEGPVGKGGTFLLTGHRSYLELIASSTGLSSVPSYGSLQSKMSYSLGSHILSWNTMWSDDHIEIERDEEENEEYNVDFNSGLFVTGITLRSFPSKSFSSEGVISYIRNKWDYQVWQDAGLRSEDRFNNRSVESELNAKYDASWFLGRHTLSAGVSIKNSRFDHDVFANEDTTYAYDTDFPSADQDTITGILAVHPAWRVEKDVSTYKKAAYAQLRLRPVRRLALRLGGRYDRMEYTDESHLSPRVAARLQLRRSLWLSAAYGIHYQSPSYLALTAHVKNRDNVDSYYTRQFVVGTEWLPRPDTRVTLEAYTKRYRDVPVAKEWFTADPWDDFDATGEMVNGALGHSEGIELYIQRKMSSSYSFILSYSFYRAFFEDPRTGDERPWDFDHRHMCTVSAAKFWRLMGASWYENMKKKWWYRWTAWLIPFGDEVQLSTRFRFAGGRPYTEPTYLREYHTWLVPADAALNTARYPDYHRLDIRLDRNYYFEGWSLSFYWDIVNIYNRKNLWGYDYDADGQVDRINQFSTVPVMGLSIKF